MGGSAERFDSPESTLPSFPRLSLDQFDLKDVRATMPSQNRSYGPHANEQLHGSVELNKLREQKFPVYDIDKDPKMDPFRTQRTQLAPKIPLGENFDLKVAGPTNFSLRKSWKF